MIKDAFNKIKSVLAGMFLSDTATIVWLMLGWVTVVGSFVYWWRMVLSTSWKFWEKSLLGTLLFIELPLIGFLLARTAVPVKCTSNSCNSGVTTGSAIALIVLVTSVIASVAGARRMITQGRAA
jgi:hypothetical protein